MIKPIYIFSGFLDSGKTSAIKSTLYNPNFNEGEATLILCFEQGDVEYDQKFLEMTNTQVIYFDSINDLSIQKQKEINKNYKFDRIFIELNGMEDDKILYDRGFIYQWEIAQTLTTVDASTFTLYMNNMRQFMYNHIYFAEMVILNRSDDVDKRFLRNNVKSINQFVEIIYEDKEGNVTNKINDELFDTTKNLVISDVDYGLWFMDAIDNPEKYDGKDITLRMGYVNDVEDEDKVIVMGRKAMVCCANDVTDIAIPVMGVGKNDIDHKKFYEVHGIGHCIRNNEGIKMYALEAKDYKETEAPADDFVTFNQEGS